MLVTLMVDGSYCPHTGAGGYGFWLASERGRMPGGGPMQTRASDACEVEMRGVCNALVQGFNGGLIQQGDHILIQTDCKAAIGAFLHQRQSLSDAEREAVRFLWSFKNNRDVSLSFRHVKGHSKRPEARYAANNHCDERAKRYMRAERAKLQQKGISNASIFGN